MVLYTKNATYLQIPWNRTIRVNVVRLRLRISYIACGLSVILIFIGIRYTGNMSFPKVEDGEDSMLPIPTNSYDGSPDVEKILENTKLKIKSEFLKYKHFGYNLEDSLMESGGTPIRSLIVSTWRSGSTFLDKVLNMTPNTFYHYEPLSYFGVIKIRDASQAVGALRIIKNLFKCNFEGIKEYFAHGKQNVYQFRHNLELWNYCKYKIDLCLDANFTSTFCRLFPKQIMKLLRIGLPFIQDILADKSLNVRVVLLVRDPRGVMQSRTNRSFCQMSPECRQPKALCADMVNDYFAAVRLLPKYPDRLMVIRYEQLAQNMNITYGILKFLKLRVTSMVKKYPEWHSINEGNSFDSFKISRDVPFKWKTILDYNYVKRIQRVCKEAMDLWGYRMAHNETHMASHNFNPLADYTFAP